MERVTVGFLVNLFRADAVEASRKAAAWLAERGVSVGAEREAAETVGVAALGSAELAESDLVVTFGGDGTLIRATHVCAPKGTPILGVYYGSFGFVTPCQPDMMESALEAWLEGRAAIESRMMVQTELIRAGQVVAELHSLNEAVVQRAATTRLLTFEVTVNGRLIARYPADGVMVATPTGSTAYNLSAGGPIVDPRMEALLLTAVMPHTLAARPLVLPSDSLVSISIEARGESLGGAVLSCDGQSRLHLLSGDLVRVTRSPRTARLVTRSGDDFLEKLSDSLGWAGRGRLV